MGLLNQKAAGDLSEVQCIASGGSCLEQPSIFPLLAKDV